MGDKRLILSLESEEFSTEVQLEIVLFFIELSLTKLGTFWIYWFYFTIYDWDILLSILVFCAKVGTLLYSI